MAFNQPGIEQEYHPRKEGSLLFRVAKVKNLAQSVILSLNALVFGAEWRK